MMDPLFSKIIARQIPADIVYEDELGLAFRDINPQAPVHILIIPNNPIPKVIEATEADKDLLGHLLIVAGKIAKNEGHEEAFRLVINNGENAGQSVFHLHVDFLAGRNFYSPT